MRAGKRPCPVCGQRAYPTDIRTLSYQARGFVRRRVLVALMNKQMKWVDLKDIKDVVYNSKPPTEGNRSIKAAIKAMNSDLHDVGWTIAPFNETGNRAESKYMLTPIMEGE